MERRERMGAVTAPAAPTVNAKKTVRYVAAVIDPRRVDSKNARSLSHNKNGRRLLPVSYFSLESLFLLSGLTALLLILPVILPPLPPPPLMLLLLPVGILGVLMVLAFMPFGAGDLTKTYM